MMEICILHAIIKCKRNVPWMNSAIGKEIKKRDSLFRAATRSGKPGDRIKYNSQRNKVVSMIRQSKRSFFDKMDSAGNSNNFWKFVRRLNHQQSLIPTLECNGMSFETSASKATVLNNYFYKCFNHNFPTLQNSDFTDNFESLNNMNCPEELLCNEDAIFDLLANLDTTKSVGSDGISAKMLKCTAASICSPLTSLCNLSISTGVFPSGWKQARIVPVPKGTNKTSPSGYRPISILPVVSKVIERHIKAIIIEHLERSAPISPKQWGFISSKSTISALIKVVDDWSRALDQGFEVCIVFF